MTKGGDGMEKHRQALRTAIIVAAVVLAVTVLLVVLFFGGSRQEAYEPITLPEAPVITPEEEPQPAEPDQNPFAVVTRENVQDVLRSLAARDEVVVVDAAPADAAWGSFGIRPLGSAG